jgi:hypothetical protein
LGRNIQRECSEEFLGTIEHDGNCVDPIAYDRDEPFVSFEQARQPGDFRVFACAIVLEPLTLWVELLTVAVIAAPAFDALFSEMVAVNEEGAARSAPRPAVPPWEFRSPRQPANGYAMSRCHLPPGPASS